MKALEFATIALLGAMALGAHALHEPYLAHMFGGACLSLVPSAFHPVSRGDAAKKE